jgi:hypothetical protein
MERFDFYSMSESGHRLEYIRFSESHLGALRVYGWNLMATKKPLLFLMVEESFLLYVLVALFRSLLGRRTVGLVFRAKDCVQSNSLKLKIKYVIMRVLKYIDNIKSLSIVPFFVYSEAERICDDWIYDFQFWDRDFLESMMDENEVSRTMSKIKNAANGRKVICAVGKQDKSKGFDEFAKLYVESEELREKYLFVSGGKVSGIDDVLVQSFEDCGALLINRRISDSELVALYRASDIVWACYSPGYDQSSGILGRAIQYGKIVVVRCGSVIERLAEQDNVKVLRVDPTIDGSRLERNILELNLSAIVNFNNSKQGRATRVIERSLFGC